MRPSGPTPQLDGPQVAVRVLQQARLARLGAQAGSRAGLDDQPWSAWRRCVVLVMTVGLPPLMLCACVLAMSLG